MSLFGGTSGGKITTPSQRDQSPAMQSHERWVRQTPYSRGLIWFSVVSLVIFSVVVASVILNKIEDQARQDIRVALHTVVQTTQEALHNGVLKRLTEVTSWSLSSELQRLVKLQLEVSRDPQALLESSMLGQMRDLLRPVMEEKGYAGFFVIAPDGTSIASMRNANVGTPNLLLAHQNFLPLVLKGNVLPSQLLPSDVPLPDALGHMAKNQPTMFVGAPIREGGVTVAVLTFRVDPVADFSSITRLGRIGETGETYAFNEAGKMITESRFEKQLREVGMIAPGMRSILNVEVRDPGGNLLEGFRPELSNTERPLTHMAQQAIQGAARDSLASVDLYGPTEHQAQIGDNLDGYRNYRGTPVVGAWVWNGELGFGLTTEVERSEAYRTYHTSRWALMIGLALTVALALGLTIALDIGRRRAVVLAGKIQDSQSSLQGILENLVEGVATVDEEGMIQSFNPAAERTFGYQKHEVMGRHIGVLMPESHQDHPESYSSLRSFFQTGNIDDLNQQQEIVGLRKNGTTFPLEVSIGEMTSDQDRGLVGIMRDVTERKRLEGELRKLSQAVEQSPASIVITNLDGEIEYVNPKFLQVTGYRPEEVIGENPRFLKSGYSSPKMYKKMWETIAAGKTWRGEFHNKKKNSELYWELASISPIKDKNGVVSHYLAVKEDITRRKETEIKLEKEGMVNRLLTDVAVASNEATAMENAAKVCLDRVCKLMGWPVGHLYVVNENSDGLAPSGIWHLDDPGRFSVFKRVTDATSFSAGEGLPGRVLSSGQPVWIVDVNKDPNFPRARRADNLGVKAGFGFPIQMGENIVGVLEFYSPEAAEPDEKLLETMSNIGTQLGRVSERYQAGRKLKASEQELRDLYNRLEAVREEERTRIARDIHDELGQMLTALKIDLSWLQKRLDSKQATVQDRAKTMSHLLDRTIKSVQEISTNLRPEVLDMLGLTEAIEWQVQEFQKRTGTECSMSPGTGDLELDPDLSTAVFRIFQETLTNVARHAAASELNIEFYKKEGELVLKVQDNGKGISEDQISHPKSLGLLGIRERALLWDGQVKISGAQGQGTTVVVKIPLR
ncbi:MAG: PAS domain S-box protein [Nitrospinaceae bacterium]|nr:PAS domain S-box protein [Nitrospinaceae bacterium]